MCQLFILVAVDIFPESQSAAPGDVVLFECIKQNFTLVWNINGSEHSRSNLPVGHWVNSSGLVVQARQALNGSTYQCVHTTIGVSGVSLIVTREGVTRSPVSLTVTSSGKRNAMLSLEA